MVGQDSRILPVTWGERQFILELERDWLSSPELRELVSAVQESVAGMEGVETSALPAYTCGDEYGEMGVQSDGVLSEMQ